MNKFEIIKEFYEFLIHCKKWWLIPIFIILGTVGSILFFAQGSVIAPFIYTLF
tara:strand:- start:747 stop:905 length:159 start_codon:yes stop_codon:yes gene_type:complete